jgi:hypothetical protein
LIQNHAQALLPATDVRSPNLDRQVMSLGFEPGLTGFLFLTEPRKPGSMIRNRRARALQFPGGRGGNFLSIAQTGGLLVPSIGIALELSLELPDTLAQILETRSRVVLRNGGQVRRGQTRNQRHQQGRGQRCPAEFSYQDLPPLGLPHNATTV